MITIYLSFGKYINVSFIFPKHHHIPPLILYPLFFMHLIIIKYKNIKVKLPGRPSPSLANFPSASDASSAL